VAKEIDWAFLFSHDLVRLRALLPLFLGGDPQTLQQPNSCRPNSLDANGLMQSNKLFGIPAMNPINIAQPGQIAVFRHALLSAAALLLCCFSALQAQAAPATFKHPGLLHSEADFTRMKSKVANGEQPWTAGYEKLVNNRHASLDWKPSPAEKIYRGSNPEAAQNYSLLYRDAAAAYAHALRWKVSGEPLHAEKAVAIMNAWSKEFKYLLGSADRFLAAGIYGYQFANAAEIMRTYPGWAAEDFERFKKMMLDIFYPESYRMLTNHNDARVDHYWANWDLASMASLIAIGVLTDRGDIYDQAIEYFKNGEGNGAVRRSVWHIHANGLGQWQEAGRDQGHSVLGIGLMAAICEMAWQQGDDLYGFDDNRFLKGAEYVAAYNLFKDVPFESYYNRSHGLQTVVSPAGRGHTRPVWEMVYNHYVKRMGISAPNVEAMAAKVRTASGGAEGGGGDDGPSSGNYDQLGFGTLTYSLSGPVENGLYAVASLNSTMLLDAVNGGVVNGTDIIQWPYNRGAHQVWRFEHLGASRYKITGAPSGLALDVVKHGVSNGSGIQLWGYHGGANQIWQVTSVDNQYFRLCPTHAPGSCLDVEGISKKRGAQVQLWKYLNGPNQQWALLPR
jgi:hypothetical protein